MYGFGLLRLSFFMTTLVGLVYLSALHSLALARFPMIGALDLFLVDLTCAVAAAVGYVLENRTRGPHRHRAVITAQHHALEIEKAKSDRLLESMLPRLIADRLRQQPARIADSHPSASVLFADLVGFTPWAAQRSPAQVVEALDTLFSNFDRMAAAHEVEKIKTVGDAYMAVAGVPVAVEDHAVRAVRLGLEMIDYLESDSELPFTVRVGVHSGPLVAGVIGRDRFAYDLWGDTVNLASRLESHGIPGVVQISEATRRLLDGAAHVEPRGEIELKGLGPIATFLVHPQAMVGASPRR